MAKVPNLKSPLSIEMQRITKRLKTLNSISEKRIEYEEENYSQVLGGTMERRDFLNRLETLLNDFSHLTSE